MGEEDDLESRTTPTQEGEDDEDITPTDTNDTPQDDIQGHITRAHARQLNLQVSSFLSNVYCESENRLLPNDLIVLRNKGEDQQGCG